MAEREQPDARRTQESEKPVADLPIADPPAQQDEVRGGADILITKSTDKPSPKLF
jgi:hypothetical protein